MHLPTVSDLSLSNTEMVVILFGPFKLFWLGWVASFCTPRVSELRKSRSLFFQVIQNHQRVKTKRTWWCPQQVMEQNKSSVDQYQQGLRFRLPPKQSDTNALTISSKRRPNKDGTHSKLVPSVAFLATKVLDIIARARLVSRLRP